MCFEDVCVMVCCSGKLCCGGVGGVLMVFVVDVMDV